MKLAKIDAVISVLVDDSDFEAVCHIGWYINEHGYARGYDSNSQKQVYMHRLLMGLTSDDERIVDHINRVTWDNRRDNLRIASRSENSLNSPAEKQKRIDCAEDRLQSKYKGVHWRSENSKWGVTFRSKYLGLYENEIDAARVYNNAAKESGIEGIWLNEIPESDAPTIGRAGTSSKYRGVLWNCQQDKWQAQVAWNGLRLHVGYFADERVAAAMRDAVVREIGAQLPLNFPDERSGLSDKILRSLRRKGLVK